jgi:hypothetical protein
MDTAENLILAGTCLKFCNVAKQLAFIIIIIVFRPQYG